MVYLDYSATTPPCSDVIDEFVLASRKYIGNPNSVHNLGINAKKRIDYATKNILNILNLDSNDVIYTSGSSEANNLAIKGVCAANKGKHIITTTYEHSSVIGPINRLCSNGYDVSFVKLNSNGTVDIDDLKNIIRDDTVLVSIVGVESEVGIKQNIDEIGLLLEKYPNCYFHVDATQMVGKTDFDFYKVDLVSFSAHKFFGIKGIGCLIKKNSVKIMPQIDGGSSTTKYRSGTPALELIVSLEKALSIALKEIESKYDYVKNISDDIKKFLSKYENVEINSTESSIPQIINFSVNDSKALVSMLNDNEVYLSTKSACSLSDSASKTIMTLYNDEQRAKNSIRISVSYKTTKEEIEEFKNIFDRCYKKLVTNNENN